MTWVLIGIGVAVALILLSSSVLPAIQKLLMSMKGAGGAPPAPSTHSYRWPHILAVIIALGMAIAGVWVAFPELFPTLWGVAKEHAGERYVIAGALLFGGVLLYTFTQRLKGSAKTALTQATIKEARKNARGGIGFFGTIFILLVLGAVGLFVIPKVHEEMNSGCTGVTELAPRKILLCTAHERTYDAGWWLSTLGPKNPAVQKEVVIDMTPPLWEQLALYAGVREAVTVTQAVYIPRGVGTSNLQLKCVEGNKCTFRGILDKSILSGMLTTYEGGYDVPDYGQTLWVQAKLYKGDQARMRFKFSPGH